MKRYINCNVSFILLIVIQLLNCWLKSIKAKTEEQLKKLKPSVQKRLFENIHGHSSTQSTLTPTKIQQTLSAVSRSPRYTLQSAMYKER